jgi:hypothetical protein
LCSTIISVNASIPSHSLPQDSFYLAHMSPVEKHGKRSWRLKYPGRIFGQGPDYPATGYLERSRIIRGADNPPPLTPDYPALRFSPNKRGSVGVRRLPSLLFHPRPPHTSSPPPPPPPPSRSPSGHRNRPISWIWALLVVGVDLHQVFSPMEGGNFSSL